MAMVKEKLKDGKVVSYKFTVFLGRDENGKKLSKCMTWYPPSDLSAAKITKAAQLEADIWERTAKERYLQEQEEAHRAIAEYTFNDFINNVWLPLCVNDGSHRPSTVAFYEYALKIIKPYFADVLLNEITGIKVNEYLNWLRSEYRKPNNGKPLAEKTIKHHYNILSIIFNYAERQEIIVKNPMKRVESPKVTKKTVDALTEYETAEFLKAVAASPLDSRTMWQMLITTGLRRGECLGLQWRDIDTDNMIIHVERSATYTKKSGIVVSAPKTATSVRTVPIMASTAALLAQLKQQGMLQYPDTIIDSAFVFGSPTDLFKPRDPNAVTRQLNRFIKANNLPNVSPHDLRHTYAVSSIRAGDDIRPFKATLATPPLPSLWMCMDMLPSK